MSPLFSETVFLRTEMETINMNTFQRQMHIKSNIELLNIFNNAILTLVTNLNAVVLQVKIVYLGYMLYRQEDEQMV